MAFDLLIQNGTVIDGTGATPEKLDVAIADGKISAIGGPADEGAVRVIDADGRVVAPGFIDIHTHCGFHTDRGLGINLNYLHQGVTSVVGGNCGFSPVDFAKLTAEAEQAALGPNLAYLVGHNSVRTEVLGHADREPTPEELSQMKRLVADAMANGAIGFSSGLYYVPGSYAKAQELIELAKTAAEYGGFYSTHMRCEGEDVEQSIAETIAIGRESGLPVQISHHKVSGVPNWGKSEKTLAMIQAARDDGIDVMADQYPYTASCARVGVLMPRWVCADGDEAAHARLDDPTTREEIKAAVVQTLATLYDGDLSRIAIASSSVAPELAGKSLADVTADLKQAAEFIMDLARERPASSDTMCVYHSMDEKDVIRIMQYPLTVIASDGWEALLGKDNPHPRLYGTFPRVLGRYCRDQQVLSLEEAVRKMTSLPARRLGVADRGIIREGACADITVFDRDTIADNATFSDPHQYPTGIDYVIVNGRVVLDHGVHTGETPGKFIVRQP